MKPPPPAGTPPSRRRVLSRNHSLQFGSTEEQVSLFRSFSLSLIRKTTSLHNCITASPHNQMTKSSPPHRMVRNDSVSKHVTRSFQLRDFVLFISLLVQRNEPKKGHLPRGILASLNRSKNAAVNFIYLNLGILSLFWRGRMYRDFVTIMVFFIGFKPYF